MPEAMHPAGLLEKHGRLVRFGMTHLATSADAESVRRARSRVREDADDAP